MRSVGYSELIVLSRDDVLTALKDHPDAEVRSISHDGSTDTGRLVKHSDNNLTSNNC